MLSNLLLSSFPGRKHQAKGVLNNAGETSRSQSVDEDSTFQSQGLQLWNHKLARVHDQGAVLDLKSFSQSNLNVLSASGRTVSFAALSAETCNQFDAASLQQQLHGLFGESRFAGVWAWDTLLHGATATREGLLSWLADHMLVWCPVAFDIRQSWRGYSRWALPR